MKWNKLALIIGMSTTMFQASAQSSYGYYGHKNFVELTTVSYVPILRNIYDFVYSGGYRKTIGGTLVETSNDWFNTGIRLSIGRAHKQNSAISLEFGYDYWSLPIGGVGSETNDGHLISIHPLQNLKMKTLRVMPKIHIAKKGSLLPIGLSHEIGFGISRTTIREKDYLYYVKVDPYEPAYFPQSTKEFIDYNQRHNGIQFLYGLKIRNPINKVFAMNYGFRYLLDFQVGSSTSFNEDFIYKNNRQAFIREYTRFNLLTNALSLDIGVTFVF